MMACKWEIFFFFFKDQGWKWCTPIPFPFYWLELNHMSPGGCKGDWEKQLCAKEEQELGL